LTGLPTPPNCFMTVLPLEADAALTLSTLRKSHA
jgi:hypothetical protein